MEKLQNNEFPPPESFENKLQTCCPITPEYFGMFSYQPVVNLHSHGRAIDIRELPLILSIPCCLSHRTGLISASCPRDILCSKKFNLGPCVTLSPRIPLVSFNLEQCISLSLTFITLILLKIKGSLIKCFLKCPSIWICLIFPHNQIQIIHFGAEKYDVCFLLHPIEWYIISI